MTTSRADEAMARYATGDDSAFSDVYDEVGPAVRNVGLRVLRDAALADDVVQHTLLNIHRKRGSFIPGAEVLPWACTIAHRVAKDILRRRMRDRRLQDAEPLRSRRVVDRPDDETVAHQTAACLQAAFAALPVSQRDVVTLRRGGLSIAQVGESLSISVAAVKQRLARATESLRAALELSWRSLP
jgi:RNA polymerase sigma-70 factor (ECF subfamily)